MPKRSKSMIATRSSWHEHLVAVEITVHRHEARRFAGLPPDELAENGIDLAAQRRIEAAESGTRAFELDGFLLHPPDAFRTQVSAMQRRERRRNPAHRRRQTVGVEHLEQRLAARRALPGRN
jgi:hypothetical protein